MLLKKALSILPAKLLTACTEAEIYNKMFCTWSLQGSSTIVVEIPEPSQAMIKYIDLSVTSKESLACDWQRNGYGESIEMKINLH